LTPLSTAPLAVVPRTGLGLPPQGVIGSPAALGVGKQAPLHSPAVGTAVVSPPAKDLRAKGPPAGAKATNTTGSTGTANTQTKEHKAKGTPPVGAKVTNTTPSSGAGTVRTPSGARGQAAATGDENLASAAAATHSEATAATRCSGRQAGTAPAGAPDCQRQAGVLVGSRA
jgi:hypothetical protein